MKQLKCAITECGYSVTLHNSTPLSAALFDGCPKCGEQSLAEVVPAPTPRYLGIWQRFVDWFDRLF